MNGAELAPGWVRGHIGGVEETEDLTPLDPRYVRALQVMALGASVPLLVAALVLESTGLVPTGLIIIPIVLIAAALVLVLPKRRYRRWGYRLDADRLRIVRGYLFHADTVVPLGRVQHIDVHQGPVTLRLGLATLTVHTAGTHNASVALPGLRHEDALAMREAIRAHIAKAQA